MVSLVNEHSPTGVAERDSGLFEFTQTSHSRGVYVRRTLPVVVRASSLREKVVVIIESVIRTCEGVRHLNSEQSPALEQLLSR